MKNALILVTLGCLANLVAAHPAPRPLRSYIRPRQRQNTQAAALAAALQQQQQQQQAGGGQQGLPGIGEGPAAAPDGTPILEDEVQINGLTMRFKISAPPGALKNAGAANAKAAGNAAAAGGANAKAAGKAAGGGAAAAGTGNAGAAAKGNAQNDRRQANAAAMGINVLFHGDGGQSFFDFPNAGVNNNLMGVALLSPDQTLRWGGQDPQDQTGLVRPDGEAHSAAVNSFLTETLPGLVDFDASQIFMEGVSGGSLMISGFTIPQFGASLGMKGAVIGCGGLSPQVAVEGDLSNLRIHWQSSQNDLEPLQTSIPEAIVAYEKIASDAGLSNAEINKLQTADNSPNGGHCEFDEKDFVTGVQLLADNFGDVINGAAQLNGQAVTNGVVGNEDLFGNGAAAAGGDAAADALAAEGAGGGNAQAAAGGKANGAAAQAAASGKAAGGANNAQAVAAGGNRNSVAAQIAALQQAQSQKTRRWF